MFTQNPVYRVPVVPRMQVTEDIPVTAGPRNTLEAEVAVVTALGEVLPGKYRLEGTSYSTMKVPWLGDITRVANTLASDALELFEEPSGRCAA